MLFSDVDWLVQCCLLVAMSAHCRCQKLLHPLVFKGTTCSKSYCTTYVPAMETFQFKNSVFSFVFFSSTAVGKKFKLLYSVTF